MKIAMMNGSPKLGNSNSGILLKMLGEMIDTEHKITHYNINKKPLTDEQYIELCHVDTLIFAFPLYIDAIPAHLFRMMITLEGYLKREVKHNISVYVIINNGFYEGHQNHIAVEIMENWCKRCGLHFGQAIGQGAGEMLGSTQNVPLGRGPNKNLGKAMQSLANNINTKSTGETILSSPNFPHFAWKLGATLYWQLEAKKNDLKIRDIKRKIETY